MYSKKCFKKIMIMIRIAIIYEYVKSLFANYIVIYNDSYKQIEVHMIKHMIKFEENFLLHPYLLKNNNSQCSSIFYCCL